MSFGEFRKALAWCWSSPSFKFAPPGHFYSPLPDLDFVERHKAKLFDRQIQSIPGIELDVQEQLALVNELSKYYRDLPFKDDAVSGLRYAFINPFFPHGDAIALYSMLRHFSPRRVIEVGSGHSSAVMLDTNDRFLSNTVEFTFIEPHPERLVLVLSDEDKQRHKIVTDIVQNVDPDLFAALEANDILFVDSSHVAKVGSDVVFLLTSVLPRLKKGVIVHFHDIFWPFEYPEEWILEEGRAWNESYVLKAFLQFNGSFKIRLFNSYLGVHHRPAVAQALPQFVENPGGSLWLEKTS